MTTTGLIEEAQQFRALAASAREQARRIAQSDARARFEQLSARYERFAQEAEERVAL